MVPGLRGDNGRTVGVTTIASPSGWVGDTPPLVGDVDGSGTPDLIVSAPGVDTGFVFLDGGDLAGSLTTDDADITITATSPDWFGISVATADLDGDAAVDLVIGASGTRYWDRADASGSGEVVLLLGASVAGKAEVTSADGFVFYDDSLDVFGRVVGAADFDGDGLDEVAVAMPGGPTSPIVFLVDSPW